MCIKLLTKYPHCSFIKSSFALIFHVKQLFIIPIFVCNLQNIRISVIRCFVTIGLIKNTRVALAPQNLITKGFCNSRRMFVKPSVEENELKIKHFVCRKNIKQTRTHTYTRTRTHGERVARRDGQRACLEMKLKYNLLTRGTRCTDGPTKWQLLFLYGIKWKLFIWQLVSTSNRCFYREHLQGEGLSPGKATVPS